MLYQKAGVERNHCHTLKYLFQFLNARTLYVAALRYPCSEFCGCANLGCMIIFNTINYDDEDKDDNLDETEE